MSRHISSSNQAASSKPARSPESYASLHRREAAAEILGSYEKLSWYSFQRCESLTQTRLHFQHIVAGFTDEDEAALVDWKEDTMPRPRRGDDGKENGKGKERGSLGARGGEGSNGGKKADGGASENKKKRKSGGGAI